MKLETYAKGTSVSVAKTQGEIFALLTGAGATDYAQGVEGGRAFIAFFLFGRQVKLSVPLPKLPPSAPSPHRRRKPPEELLAQVAREKWRSLFLVTKAKLVAVNDGIRTFEQEFLADIVVPDTGGRTVGDMMIPHLDRARRLLELVPPPGGTDNGSTRAEEVH